MEPDNYTTTTSSTFAKASVRGSSAVATAKSRWKHLFAFTRWSHSAILAAAVLSSCACAALKTALAVILGKIFDIVAAFGNGTKPSSETLSEVVRFCIILVLLGVAQWAIETAFLGTWISFGELQAQSARSTLFQDLISLRNSWYDSLPQGTSSLAVSVQTRTRELQLATSQVIGYLITDLFTAIAAISISFYYAWKLTLILLASLPISAAILSFASKNLDAAISSQKYHQQIASTVATASMRGIDHVTVCQSHHEELSRYVQRTSRAAKQYILQARCNAVQIGYVGFWVIIMFVAGFWYGLTLVDHGLSPGNVVTAFYAALAAFQGLESLLPNWLVLAKGMSAGQFLLMLQTETRSFAENADYQGTIKPSYFVGSIDLQNVSFSYPTTPFERSLQTSTLWFPAGQTTYVVGCSGSGKSTLVSLIADQYEPLTGSILLDGIPMNAFDRVWLKQNITLVQQASVIFEDTLFANIAIGHIHPDSVSRADVIAACRLVDMDSIIFSLPLGLETLVGGNSCPLSEGQRQRVVLARAYLRNPAVLILDEATSALDPSSRDVIVKSVRQWRQGKTTIIVTHDISQIDDNDYVNVFENGALTEQGFRRNLRGNQRSAFATLLPKLDTAQRVPDINIISPISEKSFEKSQVDVTRQETQLLMPKPAPSRGSSLRSGRSPISARSSLGAGAEAFMRMRNGENENYLHPAPNMETSWLFTMPQKCPASSFTERKRLSSLINKHFRTPSMHSSLELQELRHSKTQSNLPGVPIFQDTTPSDFSREELTTLHTDASQPITLIRLVPTVWPALDAKNRLLLSLGLVICIVAAVATPAFALCLANLLAAMWSSGDKAAEGKRWALYLIAVAIVDGVCTGAGRYLLEYAAQSWVDSLRAKAFRNILHQPKLWFQRAENSPGRVAESLDRNCEEMRNILGRFVPIIAMVFTMIAVSVTLAIATSWKLALVSLAPLPLVVASVKGFAIVSDRWEAKCNKGAEHSSAILTEVLSKLKSVRAFTLERHFNSKYSKSTNDALRLGLKRAICSAPLFGLYQSMSYALTALVFYYGTTLLVQEENPDITKTLRVMNLLLFSIGSATDLLSSMPQIAMALASTSHIMAFTNLPLPKAVPPAHTYTTNPLPICCNNLNFAYPSRPHKLILKDISLSILPGNCTVVVGPSGCGKSTLLSLLLQLHVPANDAPSALTFGRTPSIVTNTQTLLSKTGYVSQTAFLFPATISDNITYGLPRNSPLRNPANIHAAAKEAGIHTFITSLPEGYGTVVGEGGQKLSGGQAQRVTIARALVRRPSLLVLDEPTSALDSSNSEAVRRAIADLVRAWRSERRDAAVVMVTHDIDMMRIADHIVVMEGGTVVEQGLFEDLWFNGDAFRRLVGERGIST